MREIKFRGYGTDDKKRGWIYGNLLIEKIVDLVCIQDENCHVWEVEPESVGEYTGLKDCEGREIYEGDVIKLDNEVYTVSWAKYSACWFVDLKNFGPFLFTQYHAGKSIVIGNVHDNPDLLEVEHDRRD